MHKSEKVEMFFCSKFSNILTRSTFFWASETEPKMHWKERMNLKRSGLSYIGVTLEKLLRKKIQEIAIQSKLGELKGVAYTGHN